MTIPNWPHNNYAPMRLRATANITPFTYYDGRSYLEILEELRRWLNTVLVPGVDDVIDTVNELIDDMQDNFDGKLGELHDILTTLQGMVEDVDGKLDHAINLVSEAQSYAARAEDAANNAEGYALDAQRLAMFAQNAKIAAGDGFDPTGTTDSTDAFKAVLGSGSKRDYDTVIIPPGIYKLSDTLEVDVYRHGLIAPWQGVTLDFRTMDPDKNAIHLLSSGQPAISGDWGNEPGAPMCAMYGIRIQGAGGGGSGVYIHADGSGRSSNFKIEACVIRTFANGVLYGDHAYCITLDQVVIHRCGNGVYFPSGTTDSGERLTIVNSTIYGSGHAIRQEGAARFHVSTSSIDYNKRAVTNSGGGMVMLTDCHVESYIYNTSHEDIWFACADPGTIYIQGGVIACAARNPDNMDKPHTRVLFSSSVPVERMAGIYVMGTRLINAKTESGFLAGGSGYTHLRPTYTGTDGSAGSTVVLGSRAAGLMKDPGGNAGKLIDHWFTRNGSVEAYVNPGKGYEGGSCFRISGSGQEVLAVPIETGVAYGFRARVSKTGGTGSVNVRVAYSIVRGDTLVHEEPFMVRTVKMADVGTGWEYMVNGSYIPVRSPGWATHMSILFDTTNLDGPIYFDEVLITPR